MLNIPVPQLGKTTEAIYEECANSFVRKTHCKDNILKYKEDVKRCSASYEKYVPYEVDKLVHPKICREESVLIEKVYTRKFADKKSVGRKYYDYIMGQANQRCPICGCGKPRNLDHYLPKSKYPLLCVEARNLIPICRDCNMEKSEVTSNCYYELPFHPYFDMMKDTWVECDIIFYDDHSYSIEYYNSYNSELDYRLYKKYSTHMKVYNLDETFESRACEELSNIKGFYMNELIECGKENIKKELEKIAHSAEIIDKNSWKAALYRGLVMRCDEFCNWMSLAV